MPLSPPPRAPSRHGPTTTLGTDSPATYAAGGCSDTEESATSGAAAAVGSSTG